MLFPNHVAGLERLPCCPNDAALCGRATVIGEAPEVVQLVVGCVRTEDTPDSATAHKEGVVAEECFFGLKIVSHVGAIAAGFFCQDRTVLKHLHGSAHASFFISGPAQVVVNIVVRLPQVAEAAHGGLEAVGRRAADVCEVLLVPVVRELGPRSVVDKDVDGILAGLP